MKTKKHNHTLTNILKVFVFSLMILMPFIIFIPNAFYYGFNETAVAQEKTEQVPVYYDTNEVNSIDDLVDNNFYHIEIPTNSTLAYYQLNMTEYHALYGNSIGTGILADNIGDTPYLKRNNSDSTTQYFAYEEGENGDLCYNYNGCQFDFLYSSTINNINYINVLLPCISICPRQYIKGYQPLTTNMSITDSMSYAWKSTWQNELFSWTGNTAIYNGINATTSGIGISENSYIANYLAYIFLLTVIYIIVDIILGVFTMLTHLFNKEPK